MGTGVLVGHAGCESPVAGFVRNYRGATIMTFSSLLHVMPMFGVLHCSTAHCVNLVHRGVNTTAEILLLYHW